MSSVTNTQAWRDNANEISREVMQQGVNSDVEAYLRVFDATRDMFRKMIALGPTVSQMSEGTLTTAVVEALGAVIRESSVTRLQKDAVPEDWFDDFINAGNVAYKDVFINALDGLSPVNKPEEDFPEDDRQEACDCEETCAVCEADEEDADMKQAIEAMRSMGLTGQVYVVEL